MSRPICVLASGSAARTVDALVRGGTLAEPTRIGSLERTSIVGQEFFAAFSMEDVARMADRPVASRNRAANPATIVFSRSAQVRGVVTTHSSLARMATWAVESLGVKPGDRHLTKNEIEGGRSVFEALITLAGGATLVASPPDASQARQLAAFLRREQVSLWSTAAETLTAMASEDVVAPADFPALRQVIWWRPTLAATPLNYWKRRVGHARFTALYGAAETTAVAAAFSVPADERVEADLPVGSPRPGHEVLVLNDQLQPAGEGQVGDLWIRGLGLSPGYWDDAAATADAFRPVASVDGRSGRMWRTGDRGRRSADGFVYLSGAEPPAPWPGRPMSVPVEPSRPFASA